MPKGVYPRKPRPSKQDAAALAAKVRELYECGLTQREVAERLHLSQKSIFGIMRRAGIATRKAVPRNQVAEANNNWRGDAAGYQALHKRLYVLHGKPSRCSVCGTTAARHYDYANLTGNYADAADYAAMCRSCHWKHDGKVLNLHKREATHA